MATKLDIYEKYVDVDEETKCEVCMCKQAERTRFWLDGECIVQVFRCACCGSVQAWSPDNDPRVAEVAEKDGKECPSGLYEKR